MTVEWRIKHAYTDSFLNSHNSPIHTLSNMAKIPTPSHDCFVYSEACTVFYGVKIFSPVRMDVKGMSINMVTNECFVWEKNVNERKYLPIEHRTPGLLFSAKRHVFVFKHAHIIKPFANHNIGEEVRGFIIRGENPMAVQTCY